LDFVDENGFGYSSLNPLHLLNYAYCSDSQNYDCLFIEFKRKGTPILFSLIKHVEILLEAISVTEETFL